MKKTLLLLSLAGCVVMPAITQADTPNPRTTKITQTTPAKPASSTKVVYYITQEARTGSAIPMVFRRYNGYIDSASSPAVYGQNAITQSGALDVSAALNRLDPSISLGHTRH